MDRSMRCAPLPCCLGTGCSHTQGFLTPRETAQLQARISSTALAPYWSTPGFFSFLPKGTAIEAAGGQGAPGACQSPQALLCGFGLFPFSPFFLRQCKPSVFLRAL